MWGKTKCQRPELSRIREISVLARGGKYGIIRYKIWREDETSRAMQQRNQSYQ